MMILKINNQMIKIIRIMNYVFLFFLIILLTDCSSTQKNPYYQKRIKASRVNTTQLGRNRYYFSNDYQKKLVKSYKKKK